jgi:hypothetical protein
MEEYTIIRVLREAEDKKVYLGGYRTNVDLILCAQRKDTKGMNQIVDAMAGWLLRTKYRDEPESGREIMATQTAKDTLDSLCKKADRYIEEKNAEADLLLGLTRKDEGEAPGNDDNKLGEVTSFFRKTAHYIPANPRLN